jgi:hypothetical protein
VSYAQLPLVFEANVGQTAADVKFLSRRGGYMLFLTATETVFRLPLPPVLKPEAKQMRPEEIAKGESPETWEAHDKQGGRPSWAGRDSALVRKGPGRPPWAGSDVEFDNAPMTRSATVRFQLRGANETARVEGLDRSPGVVNYYRGNDPKQWRENVPVYRRVHYEQIYPGIDLVYYGNLRRLEYDFVVSPDADPSAIAFEVAGADKVELNDAGELVMHLGEKHLVQRKPVSYQQIDGVRRDVESRFALSDRQVRFELGPYDTGHELFIDPVIDYSTFLGGSGDDLALGIAVDADGNAYVTGKTASTDFPTQNAFQTANATIIPSGNSRNDVFITKLNAEGTDIVYSTYLGGGE